MDIAGPRLVGDWEVGTHIGSGSFAIVWRGRHRLTGQEAAIKEIDLSRLSSKLWTSLQSEVAILRGIHHPNIVSLLDVIETHSKLFLVMEYCAGGDLSQFLRQNKAVSEATARSLLRQLAAGLREMWTRSLVHRDLKPQNLILSKAGPEAELKIADFGFARILQPQGLAETLCGSPLYMAPEILGSHRYDAKADLWSVGVVLFEMVAGRPPYSGANQVQLLRNIRRGPARLPEQAAQTLSAPCRHLIGELLRVNPVERISFEDFFRHPFLALTPLAGRAAGPAAGDPAAAPARRFASSLGGGQALPRSRSAASVAQQVMGFAGAPGWLPPGPTPHAAMAPGALTRALCAPQRPPASGAWEPAARIDARAAAREGADRALSRGRAFGAGHLPLDSERAPSPTHRVSAPIATSAPVKPVYGFEVGSGGGAPRPRADAQPWRGGSSGRNSPPLLRQRAGASDHPLILADQGSRSTDSEDFVLVSASGSGSPPPVPAGAAPMVEAAADPAPALSPEDAALWVEVAGMLCSLGCTAAASYALESDGAVPRRPAAALSLLLAALSLLRACGARAAAPEPAQLAEQAVAAASAVAKRLSREASAEELPDPWEALYAAALGWARDAAVQELVVGAPGGGQEASQDLYARAVTALRFLLRAADGVPGLSTPVRLDAEERDRLQRYAAAIGARWDAHRVSGRVPGA